MIVNLRILQTNLDDSYLFVAPCVYLGQSSKTGRPRGADLTLRVSTPRLVFGDEITWPAARDKSSSARSDLVAGRRGCLPVVFDNLSRGHRAAVLWGRFVEGELDDATLLAQTFREYSVSAVRHFAAYANVGEAVTDPALYYRNNIG